MKCSAAYSIEYTCMRLYIAQRIAGIKCPQITSSNFGTPPAGDYLPLGFDTCQLTSGSTCSLGCRDGYTFGGKTSASVSCDEALQAWKPSIQDVGFCTASLDATFNDAHLDGYTVEAGSWARKNVTDYRGLPGFALSGYGTVRSVSYSMIRYEKICMQSYFKNTQSNQMQVQAYQGGETKVLHTFSESVVWKAEKFWLTTVKSADTRVQLQFVATNGSNVLLDEIKELRDSECYANSSGLTSSTIIVLISVIVLLSAAITGILVFFYIRQKSKSPQTQGIPLQGINEGNSQVHPPSDKLGQIVVHVPPEGTHEYAEINTSRRLPELPPPPPPPDHIETPEYKPVKNISVIQEAANGEYAEYRDPTTSQPSLNRDQKLPTLKLGSAGETRNKEVDVYDEIVPAVYENVMANQPNANRDVMPGLNRNQKLKQGSAGEILHKEVDVYDEIVPAVYDDVMANQPNANRDVMRKSAQESADEAGTAIKSSRR